MDNLRSSWMLCLLKLNCADGGGTGDLCSNEKEEPAAAQCNGMKHLCMTVRSDFVSDEDVPQMRPYSTSQLCCLDLAASAPLSSVKVPQSLHHWSILPQPIHPEFSFLCSFHYIFALTLWTPKKYFKTFLYLVCVYLCLMKSCDQDTLDDGLHSFYTAVYSQYYGKKKHF